MIVKTTWLNMISDYCQYVTQLASNGLPPRRHCTRYVHLQ